MLCYFSWTQLLRFGCLHCRKRNRLSRHASQKQRWKRTNWCQWRWRRSRSWRSRCRRSFVKAEMLLILPAATCCLMIDSCQTLKSFTSSSATEFWDLIFGRIAWHCSLSSQISFDYRRSFTFSHFSDTCWCTLIYWHWRADINGVPSLLPGVQWWIEKGWGQWVVSHWLGSVL